MPISAFTASDVVTSPTSSTRSRNQPANAVVDLREAAEAREADDLEARAEALGGDLADQAFEVVLAAVERAGEAVERDALDGRAEAGHAATAFMVLVSCSSMWSVSVSEMMMYGM